LDPQFPGSLGHPADLCLRLQWVLSSPWLLSHPWLPCSSQFLQPLAFPLRPYTPSDRTSSTLHPLDPRRVASSSLLFQEERLSWMHRPRGSSACPRQPDPKTSRAE
jgi:hypothetical protein